MNLPIPTNFPIAPGLLSSTNPVVRRQSEDPKFVPVLKISRSTLPSSNEFLDADSHTMNQGVKNKFEPPMTVDFRAIRADSTPLQIWEGTVIEVDHKASVMHVELNAKIGQIPRHTGEIDLEWVTEQDKDLVNPGAVFYLTLYKRTERGSIQNSQELRFRRRPSWSAEQLDQIDKDAAKLLSKMKALPTSV